MGRKKGKQSGRFGSKKLRAQAERLQWKEANEDLAACVSAPRRLPLVSVARHRSMRAAPAKVQWHEKRASTVQRLVDMSSSLVAACAAIIGRHFDDFVADADTMACFALIPAHAIELISQHAAVNARNVELLSHTEARRLDIRGEVGDNDLARAILPRRCDFPPAYLDDEWLVRDVTLGLRGCFGLRQLCLDAPVSWRFFHQLCRALPELTRLELGPRCPPEAIDILVAYHASLETLDLRSCSWFDPADFAAAAYSAQVCTREPPAQDHKPLEIICVAETPRREKCSHPQRGASVTIVVEYSPAVARKLIGERLVNRSSRCSHEAIFGTGRPRVDFVQHQTFGLSPTSNDRHDCDRPRTLLPDGSFHIRHQEQRRLSL